MFSYLHEDATTRVIVFKGSGALGLKDVQNETRSQGPLSRKRMEERRECLIKTTPKVGVSKSKNLVLF